ncbi:FecR family protein [Dyadobacter subterraneus]|uniref:FecR family protein n=1 Tax=Dyadobacter subterraneus TaxID=2773304 RepID=A0ABR9WDD7_9BACT|nr:FecR family protein [Dyadobacter subterraneus]MBE9463490.1 FecR family protein [Dyadobacter subterraneus]
MINRELLQKLREGRCTPDELAVLQNYFDRNDMGEIKNLLTEDWQNADEINDPFLQNSADSAQAHIWEQLNGVLQTDVNANKPPQEHKKSQDFWYMAAASIALVLFAGAGWFLMKPSKINDISLNDSEQKQSVWIEKQNITLEKMSVRLIDGSVVTLSQHSKLSYPEKFEGHFRQVKLTGEAFFAVHRDTLHPFTIRTAALQIRVLGTSFNVAEKAGSITEVAVKSGKVMVASLSSKTKLFLGPNEQAVENLQEGKLTKTLVLTPEIVNPEIIKNRFEFNDAAVSEAFDILQQAYHVEIVYDRQILGNCPLTARLTDQPLFTKLDMICASIGASYHLEGARIFIDGSGCNND